MSNFIPLNVKKYQKPETVITPDTIYWKRLGVPTLVKEFGAIDYVDFNSIEPHYFAVTCSVRVQIYNPITKLVVKNLSRFQETAYGGNFRQDGRLLIAGDEQGFVKLFDPSSKNVLRLFKGHKAPVHRTFFTADMMHVASFCDDKTVKLWDIATEKVKHTYNEHHSDYIRAGAVNPLSKDLIVSGGYDGKINLYDTRTENVSFTVDHGCPVESLLFLPTGSIIISAGGTEVRVWDCLAGGRLLTRLSHHHKTVTCLRLGSNGKRFLSGGLDRHVKIYDVASYQTVHTLDFPNSVLSLGVAPNDRTVVAGMIDGLISIQNMENDRKEERLNTLEKKHTHLTSVKVDHVVAYVAKPKQAKHDKLLRKYEYSKCLDSVLAKEIMNKTPQITVSVMQELIHRKGLHRALAGRSDQSLILIIKFICRYIGEHRFMRVLIDVANILLDTYENNFHEFTGEVGKAFIYLCHVVQKEVALTHELLELQGAITQLIESANIANDKDEIIHFIDDNEEKMILKQTVLAKKSSIVTV